MPMLWVRRSLVLAPVLLFIGSVILLSCGGGSSGTSPTPTPTVLVGLYLCFGPPPTGTPVPTVTPTPNGSPTKTPTSTKTPTPSPTPPCQPTATSTPLGIGDQLQLNAQGIFTRPSHPGKYRYRDVTPPNGGATFRTNSSCSAVVVSTTNPGIFVGTQTGCCCILASDGSILSPEFSVNVNGAPDCDCSQPVTPFPTPSGTPTPRFLSDDDTAAPDVDISPAPDSATAPYSDSDAEPETSP
jgi:hypothetical protein